MQLNSVLNFVRQCQATAHAIPINTMKKLLSTLCILLLAGALAACTTTQTSTTANTPQAFAIRFTKAYHQGDVETIFKLIHWSDDAKAHPGLEDMLRGKIKIAAHHRKQRTKQQGGISHITTREPSYSNGKKQAEVPVTVQFKNGKKHTKSIHMVWVKNRWMIGGDKEQVSKPKTQ